MTSYYPFMFSRLRGGLLLMVLFTCLAVMPATAQTLIFNVPSTDVIAADKCYVEFDYYTHLEKLENGGYHGFSPRIVKGVGKGVEVGVNVAFAKALTPNQPVQISPNIKWQFYSNEENGVSATVGGIAYVTVKNRAGSNNYGMLYANTSKKFKGNYGPRVTGGYYQLAGNLDGLGTTKGALLGYEQPLHSTVAFSVDWISGNNSLGYLTPALTFNLPKNSIFFVGWLIGNQGRKNNYLYVGYGITL